MRNPIVSAALITLAFAGQLWADDAADVRATIEEHYRAINGEEGEVRDASDVETITRHHLPDYTLFPWHGGMRREGGWRESAKRMGASVEFQSAANLRMTSFKTQIYGDVAVVTFYLVGTLGEQPVTNRVSSVWVKGDEGWREAHHHESPLRVSGVP
jgi:ketosteroid isomerase-like protein